MVGVCCNLFIVGLNQLVDVQVDRINKPWLPLPSGTLRRGTAWGIVLMSLVVALGMALWVSPWLCALVAVAAFLGWAYSMRPLHLKRHHLGAAVAISTVRALVLNLGGFVVYDHLVNGAVAVPMDVWMLTGFILVFSVSIAWFKDLPDMAGDARYGIRTLPLMWSPHRALAVGHLLVSMAYLSTIGLLWLREASLATEARTQVLLIGHIVLFLLFLLNCYSFHGGSLENVRRFYARYWLFFFAEYLLYLGAYTLA